MPVIRALCQPWSDTRVGDELLAALAGDYVTMTAAIGFVNASGIRHLAPGLEQFRSRGGTIRMAVGVDGTITSESAVRALLRLTDELWLLRNSGRPLFHPKTYLFGAESDARAILGSANLTENALWVNYEDVLVVDLDLADPADQLEFTAIGRSFTNAIASPNAERTDDQLIELLVAAGLLPSEAKRRRQPKAPPQALDPAAPDLGSMFPATPMLPPPSTAPLPEELVDEAAHARRRVAGAKPPRPGVLLQSAQRRTFVLRLGSRDAGRKPGFSPDIFIPLAAYRESPQFWGTLTRKVTPGDFEYWERYAFFEFQRRLAGHQSSERRLYLYPRRSEFRFNSSEMAADSTLGDLLVVQLAQPGANVEYIAQIIRQTDSSYAAYNSIASNEVAGSGKRWGYA